MDIKSILGLIRKPKSSIAELEATLNALDVADARGQVEKLETERRKVLVTGDDAELAAIDEKIRTAHNDVERTVAMRAELEVRLAEVQCQNDEAACRRAYDQAVEKTKFGLAALKAYPSAAGAIVDILAKVAAAEEAINMANAGLSPGAAALPSVEMQLRGLPAEPRQRIGEDYLGEAWFFTGQSAHWGEVDASQVASIYKKDGKHWIEARINGAFTSEPRQVEKRRVKRVSYREARGAFSPVPLAASIVLPGLMPGQEEIWVPVGPSGYGDSVGADPGAVLGQVEVARAALASPAGDPRPSPVITGELEREAAPAAVLVD